MPLADAGADIADYIRAVALVYTIILIAHIILRMAYEFGARIPYSRAMDWFSSFLHDVSEPYLRIFRRVIPSRKQSANGVWTTPSRMKKTFAPVHSATRPCQSSISASA